MPIPEVPEERDPAYRRIQQFHDRWKTAPLRMMENSFDNAHFSFVHKGTFGQLRPAQAGEIRLKETDYGFQAETLITIDNPPEAYRITGTTDPETKRHMRNDWFMPFCRRSTSSIRPGCATSSSTARRRSTTATSSSCRSSIRNDRKRVARPKN